MFSETKHFVPQNKQESVKPTHINYPF